MAEWESDDKRCRWGNWPKMKTRVFSFCFCRRSTWIKSHRMGPRLMGKVALFPVTLPLSLKDWVWICISLNRNEKRYRFQSMAIWVWQSVGGVESFPSHVHCHHCRSISTRLQVSHSCITPVAYCSEFPLSIHAFPSKSRRKPTNRTKERNHLTNFSLSENIFWQFRPSPDGKMGRKL